MQIKNSTFVVTGGASGLGEGTVKMLVECGASRGDTGVDVGLGL